MLTTKANPTKLLVSTVLVALLCAPLVSAAFAAPDYEGRTPVSAGDSSAVKTPDCLPVLIQQRDNNPTKDNSTAPTDAQAGHEPNLIATNTKPDNTAVTVGAAVVALAIAVGASVAVVRGRKK